MGVRLECNGRSSGRAVKAIITDRASSFVRVMNDGKCTRYLLKQQAKQSTDRSGTDRGSDWSHYYVTRRAQGPGAVNN
jgi:hypothetical protein